MCFRPTRPIRCCTSHFLSFDTAIKPVPVTDSTVLLVNLCLLFRPRFSTRITLNNTLDTDIAPLCKDHQLLPEKPHGCWRTAADFVSVMHFHDHFMTFVVAHWNECASVQPSALLAEGAWSWHARTAIHGRSIEEKIKWSCNRKVKKNTSTPGVITFLDDILARSQSSDVFS